MERHVKASAAFVCLSLVNRSWRVHVRHGIWPTWMCKTAGGDTLSLFHPSSLVSFRWMPLDSLLILLWLGLFRLPAPLGPTGSNQQVDAGRWMLDVGCWMLDDRFCLFFFSFTPFWPSDYHFIFVIIFYSAVTII